MADSHAKMTQATPQEVVISVIAGLLAPLLAIFLIVQLVLGIQRDHKSDTTSDAAQQATLKRIQPVAKLAALDANAPRVEKSGQQVYDAVCASCHGSGALGAPKFEARGDWAGRLGQGYDTLVKHAIEGLRQMPPRGGDSDLSDTEVARAVAYLANSAGASFKAPEPSAATAAAAPDASAAEPGSSGMTAPTNAAPAAPTATAPAASAPTQSKPAASAPTSTAPAASAPAADLAHGRQIYRQACAVCHDSGVAGAPKIGDAANWGPRVAQGVDTLYASGLRGKGAMPAKGGNPALSDGDVKAAVDYMVAQAR